MDFSGSQSHLETFKIKSTYNTVPLFSKGIEFQAQHASVFLRSNWDCGDLWELLTDNGITFVNRNKWQQIEVVSLAKNGF